MSDEITEFRIEIPDDDLADLRRRLQDTRWPGPEQVTDWFQGVPLFYLQELFIITHGWPGSAIQFPKVIGPLTDPPAHGGDAADAFRVVCPSLPRYGFSGQPDQPGWREDSGYSKEQATRPQTIGYPLVDSPVALCAWIIEKFRAWTDSDGHPENVLTQGDLLDNVMLYWLPRCGASAARLYWESIGLVNKRISGPPTVAWATRLAADVSRSSFRALSMQRVRADRRRPAQLMPGGHGHDHPSICLEGCTGRRAAGRRAEPPAPGREAGAHAAPGACGSRRSAEAAGPAATPPSHRLDSSARSHR